MASVRATPPVCSPGANSQRLARATSRHGYNPAMTIRRYDNEKDFDAARRIWLECGWLEGKEDAPLKAFLECATAWVGELDGEAETLVLNIPATVRHMNQDLPLAAVAAVTTSRVARKQGLAGRATVRAIAHDANEGALVAALGMFEQG
jgi:hypothetical protein